MLFSRSEGWIADAWTAMRMCPGWRSGLGRVVRVRVGGREGSGRVSWRACIVVILGGCWRGKEGEDSEMLLCCLEGGEVGWCGLICFSMREMRFMNLI